MRCDPVGNRTMRCDKHNHNYQTPNGGQIVVVTQEPANVVAVKQEPANTTIKPQMVDRRTPKTATCQIHARATNSSLCASCQIYHAVGPVARRFY